jgi:hypothetical protein
MLKGAAVASFVLFTLSSDSEARTRCSYSGPPENLLTVRTTGDAVGELGRLGEQIVVWERRPRPCSGGVPTVFNTNTIRVLIRGLLAGVALRLDGGPFAPGAMPEAEGAPEIEIEVRGGDFSRVIGTPQADEFHWGPGRGHPGLNLNPGGAADQDVDVSTVGRFSRLVAYGGAGDDMIVPGPSAVADREAANAYGDPGDDLLTAPQRTNGVLIGGSDQDGRGSCLGFSIPCGAVRRPESSWSLPRRRCRSAASGRA